MAKKGSKKEPKFNLAKSLVKKLFFASLVLCLSLLAVQFFKKYSIEIKSKYQAENLTSKPLPSLLPGLLPNLMPRVLPSVDHEEVIQSTTKIVCKSEPRPKYWFYMNRGYMWIFFSVDNVLQKLGLERIDMKIESNKKVHNDWNLLWSYDYHNEIPIDFKNLSFHQKINHIPGNYVLCMKENLGVNTDSKYIPKAFNNSKSLLEYAVDHPETRFVQKLWSNRGVALKNASEISFEMFGPANKYFAQVYVENPLLIDGHKFDFGIYVLVTSIDPLRIYYYNKNTLIRLCEEKYDPTNYDDINSYVIGDACLFPWDMDVLSVYYNNSYTYKEAMNAYFTNQGYDMERVWSQVEDCISSIVVSKEDSFIYWVRSTTTNIKLFLQNIFVRLKDIHLNIRSSNFIGSILSWTKI